MTRLFHRERMGLLLLAGGLLAVTAVDAAAAEGSSYVKKATLPETMLAARAQFARQTKAGPVEMTAWSTTGPLKAKNFSEAFFPEKEVDLQAKGPGGRPLWTRQPQWSDGQTRPLPTSRGSESTYLFRTITAKEAVTLPVELDSDDGLEVWLNGEKLFSKATVNTGVPVDLALRAGENRLLLKVYNAQGDHSYRFANRSMAVPTPLWQQLKSRFPRPGRLLRAARRRQAARMVRGGRHDRPADWRSPTARRSWGRKASPCGASSSSLARRSQRPTISGSSASMKRSAASASGRLN